VVDLFLRAKFFWQPPRHASKAMYCRIAAPEDASDDAALFFSPAGNKQAPARVSFAATSQRRLRQRQGSRRNPKEN
jgi:hypothetical protein